MAAGWFTMTVENSDVLLPGSVAVALMPSPAGMLTGRATEKLAFPLPSVVTVVAPSNSPSLEELPGASRKNWIK